jgi:hypothetical protein
LIYIYIYNYVDDLNVAIISHHPRGRLLCTDVHELCSFGTWRTAAVPADGLKTVDIPVPPMSKIRAPKISKSMQILYLILGGRPPWSKKRNQTQSIIINCTER